MADPAGGRASVRKPRSAIFPQPPTPPAGRLIGDVRYSYVLAEFPVLSAQEIWEVVDLQRENTAAAALTDRKEVQQSRMSATCSLFYLMFWREAETWASAHFGAAQRNHNLTQTGLTLLRRRVNL